MKDLARFSAKQKSLQEIPFEWHEQRQLSERRQID